MRGIRCSIPAILAVALMGMLNGSFTLPPCVVVAVAAFAMYQFLGLSSAWIVVFGAVCGLVISGFYEQLRLRSGHLSPEEDPENDIKEGGPDL